MSAIGEASSVAARVEACGVVTGEAGEAAGAAAAPVETAKHAAAPAASACASTMRAETMRAAAAGAAGKAFLPVSGASTSSQPAMLWRTPQQPTLDRNTVDLDRERANFADNSLRYEATLRFINGNVRNVLSAIRGE